LLKEKIKENNVVVEMNTRSSLQTKLQKMIVDDISKQEQEEAEVLMMKAFASGGLAFSFVENKEFREFIKYLRPAYKIPCRQTLSNTILNKTHDKMMIEQKYSSPVQATLMIDGWKQDATGKKYTAALLKTHDIEQKEIFLTAFDYTGK
jgi:hypothetical protein